MEDLSLHILDIVENSVAAHADQIEIRISEDKKKDLLSVEIIDNGTGMDKKTVEKALDPFYTTKTVRRFGLGLSLLSDAAKAANGHLSIKSKEVIEKTDNFSTLYSLIFIGLGMFLFLLINLFLYPNAIAQYTATSYSFNSILNIIALMIAICIILFVNVDLISKFNLLNIYLVIAIIFASLMVILDMFFCKIYIEESTKILSLAALTSSFLNSYFNKKVIHNAISKNGL